MKIATIMKISSIALAAAVVAAVLVVPVAHAAPCACGSYVDGGHVSGAMTQPPDLRREAGNVG